MIFLPRAVLTSACLLCLAAQAQKSPADLGIAAEGRIVPGNGLVTVAAPGIVTEVKVKVGDVVKKGDTLAILQGADAAEAAIMVAEAQEMVAKAAIKVAKTRKAAADFSADASEKQKAVLQAGIAEAESGVAVAKASMAQALAEHDAASKKLSGQIAEYQRILDEFDPPRREKEDLISKQNMVRLEVANLDQTRAALEAQWQAQVAQAEAALKSAQSQLPVADAQTLAAQADAGVAQAQSEYQAERELAVAQASVAQAQAEAQAFTVTSPMDGTVIRINAQPGEAVGPEGVLYLGDTTKMFVDAQIYIDDIRRVKLGQKVVVSGTPLGEDLTGKVAEISLMVSQANLYTPDPTVFTDRRVVPIRIALDDAAQASKLIYAQVTVKISQGGE